MFEMGVKMKKSQILWKIFVATIYLSAFTFGGGYVIISLLKDKFVNQLKWIEEEEMLDLVAIAQSSPGAIAVNGAIVIGYKLGGLLGTLAAVFGAVLPPLIIISLISIFYEAFRDIVWIRHLLTGMQAGVGALIVSVVYDMGSTLVKEKKISTYAIMLLSFIANFIFQINVIYIILAVAFYGVIVTVYSERKGRLS